MREGKKLTQIRKQKEIFEPVSRCTRYMTYRPDVISINGRNDIRSRRDQFATAEFGIIVHEFLEKCPSS